jgi:hypothetical protein
MSRYDEQKRARKRMKKKRKPSEAEKIYIPEGDFPYFQTISYHQTFPCGTSLQ